MPFRLAFIAAIATLFSPDSYAVQQSAAVRVTQLAQRAHQVS